MINNGFKNDRYHAKILEIILDKKLFTSALYKEMNKFNT